MSVSNQGGQSSVKATAAPTKKPAAKATAIPTPEPDDDAIAGLTVGQDEKITLATPKILRLLTTSQGLRVGWTSVAGATKYEVWRSTKSASGFTRIATTMELDYYDTTAKRYTAYYYKIRAVAGSSVSAFSAINSRWHDVGPAITFTVDDAGYTTISWNAKTKVSGYYLFRA